MYFGFVTMCGRLIEDWTAPLIMIEKLKNIGPGKELHCPGSSSSLIARSSLLIYVQSSVPLMKLCLAVRQWRLSKLH